MNRWATWWRHQMETFSALLAICAGNSPVPGEFPAQRPVTQSFEVFYDLRLNKRLSKQSWGWWFETLSGPLLRHCNEKSLISHMGWRASKWYIWWIPMNTGASYLTISYLQMSWIVWGDLFLSYDKHHYVCKEILSYIRFYKDSIIK